MLRPQKITILLFLAIAVHSFGTLITLDASTSSSIADYNQDLGTCSCNLLTNVCDNFCCCDTTCTTVINLVIFRKSSQRGPMQNTVDQKAKAIYNYSAMMSRVLDFPLLKTLDAFTSRIEERSAISSVCLTQLRLFFRLPMACKNFEL